MTTGLAAAITVDNLRRRYGPAGEGGYDAVRGVDLEVSRGELFALPGTNGAGQTPLLVLAGWVVVGGWVTRRWFRWEPRR